MSIDKQLGKDTLWSDRYRRYVIKPLSYIITVEVIVVVYTVTIRLFLEGNLGWLQAICLISAWYMTKSFIRWSFNKIVVTIKSNKAKSGVN